MKFTNELKWMERLYGDPLEVLKGLHQEAKALAGTAVSNCRSLSCVGQKVIFCTAYDLEKISKQPDLFEFFSFPQSRTGQAGFPNTLSFSIRNEAGELLTVYLVEVVPNDQPEPIFSVIREVVCKVRTTPIKISPELAAKTKEVING